MTIIISLLISMIYNHHHHKIENTSHQQYTIFIYPTDNPSPTQFILFSLSLFLSPTSLFFSLSFSLSLLLISPFIVLLSLLFCTVRTVERREDLLTNHFLLWEMWWRSWLRKKRGIIHFIFFISAIFIAYFGSIIIILIIILIIM